MVLELCCSDVVWCWSGVVQVLSWCWSSVAAVSEQCWSGVGAVLSQVWKITVTLITLKTGGARLREAVLLSKPESFEHQVTSNPPALLLRDQQCINLTLQRNLGTLPVAVCRFHGWETPKKPDLAQGGLTWRQIFCRRIENVLELVSTHLYHAAPFLFFLLLFSWVLIMSKFSLFIIKWGFSFEACSWGCVRKLWMC